MCTAVGRRAAARAALLGLLVASVSAGLLAGPAGPAQAVSRTLPQLVGEDPADNTPQVVDGSVNAIVQVGSRIVLGGTFTGVQDAGSSTTIPRRGLLAFDAASGIVDRSFDAQLDGNVESLDTDGTSVYAAGDFRTARGVPALRVAKLSMTGAPDPAFQAGADRVVHEVVVRGARAYVGGAFTSLGTPAVPREGLAALDKDTGAVLPELNLPVAGTNSGGETNVGKLDVSPDGRTLILIGNFTSVGGLPRSQMAMVDLPVTGSATVSNWSTDRFGNVCAPAYNSYLRDLDIDPGGRYVVVTTSGAYGAGALCDTISRWEVTPMPAAQPTWIDYTGGDTSYGVAATGPVVYVGGHFRWMNNPYGSDRAGPGAVPREGIAALDPLSGLPLSWNPGRARGYGAQALYATDQGLWVGSDTTQIGRPRETRARIAFFPVASGTPLPVLERPAWPGQLYQVERDRAALTRRQMSARGRPGAPVDALPDAGLDWSTVSTAFLTAGTLYYGGTDGLLRARSIDTARSVLGTARVVDLRDDPDTGARVPFAVSRLTGAFLDPDTLRLYYTLAGDSRLFFRWMSPESDVVGAEEFVAASPGLDFSTAAGMTLASGKVWFGSTRDGFLRSAWLGPRGVSGPATIASTTGAYRGRALFAAPPPAGNQPPSASSSVSCAELTCTFDGATSTDDGSVAGWAWDFGDGTTGRGRTVQHTYATSGTRTVTLVVTDDQGVNSEPAGRQVAISVPATPISFRSASTASGYATRQSVTVPDSVQPGDALLLLGSVSGRTGFQDPVGWTRVASQAAPGDASRAVLWSRVAAAGDAGRQVTVGLGVSRRTNLTLLAYAGTDPISPVTSSVSQPETTQTNRHTTPGVNVPQAGSWLVSWWQDASGTTTGWVPPTGQAVRSQLTTPGGYRLSDLVTDSGGGVAAAVRGRLDAVAQPDAVCDRATMWSIVLAPAPPAPATAARVR